MEKKRHRGHLRMQDLHPRTQKFVRSHYFQISRLKEKDALISQGDIITGQIRAILGDEDADVFSRFCEVWGNRFEITLFLNKKPDSMTVKQLIHKCLPAFMSRGWTLSPGNTSIDDSGYSTRFYPDGTPGVKQTHMTDHMEFKVNTAKACKRVLVKTEMVEQTTYKTVCEGDDNES